MTEDQGRAEGGVGDCVTCGHRHYGGACPVCGCGRLEETKMPEPLHERDALVAIARALPGSWKMTHVEPTGMSHTERVSTGQIAQMVLEALADADYRIIREFECSSCSGSWAEDDCQQIQPDGRWACPLPECGEDTLTVVTSLLGSLGSAQS